MRTQDTELGASPAPEANIGPLPSQDFVLQQDNLLDHLVPAEAREDEVETSEQHREAGTTFVDSYVSLTSLRPSCTSTVTWKNTLSGHTCPYTLDCCSLMLLTCRILWHSGWGVGDMLR